MKKVLIVFYAIASIAILAACSSIVPVIGPYPTSAPTMAMPTSGPTMSASPSAGTEVSIANFAFSPDTLTIKAGTTVVWTNKDSAAHTVTADDQSFDSGNLNQGQSFRLTFQQAGTFSYHCSFHPNMKATIVVTSP